MVSVRGPVRLYTCTPPEVPKGMYQMPEVPNPLAPTPAVQKPVPSAEIAARALFWLYAAVRRVEVSTVSFPAIRPTILLVVSLDVRMRAAVVGAASYPRTLAYWPFVESEMTPAFVSLPGKVSMALPPL